MSGQCGGGGGVELSPRLRVVVWSRHAGTNNAIASAGRFQWERALPLFRCADGLEVVASTFSRVVSRNLTGGRRAAAVVRSRSRSRPRTRRSGAAATVEAGPTTHFALDEADLALQHVFSFVTTR